MQYCLVKQVVGYPLVAHVTTRVPIEHTIPKIVHMVDSIEIKSQLFTHCAHVFTGLGLGLGC